MHTKMHGCGLPPAKAFLAFATRCRHRIELATPRRRANALNIEIGTPQPRCLLKTPKSWEGRGAPSAPRWLASGGDAYVFGPCSRRCALGHEWCESCGHRHEHHDMPGKPHVCAVDGCGCDGFRGRHA